jgi:hypothetical protein
MNGKRPVDMTGQRIGKWTVLRYSHRSEPPRPRTYWWCRCDCGTEKAVLAYGLRNGTSKSCGCRVSGIVAKAATTHGLSRHPAYSSYRAMVSRCTYANSETWGLYGGRGIKICDRWSTFEGFWADMGPSWRPGLWIERKDVNGNYEPPNCRWATPMEQGANRRSNVILQTPDGPMTLAQAARKYGVGYQTISSRIRYGWKMEDVFLPVTKDNSRRETNVIINTPDGPMIAARAAKKYGLGVQTLFARIWAGWPEEDLLIPPGQRRHTERS